MNTPTEQKFKVTRVKEFDKWVDTLTPAKLAVVLEREKNMEKGTLGDYKPVGDGVCEARIFIEGGLRIYFLIVKSNLILLIHGGDKGSQDQDIKDAKAVLKRLKERSEAIKKRDSEKKL